MKSAITLPKQPKAPIWVWLVCGFIGLLIGVGSAWAISNGALGSAKLAVGSWQSDPLVGAKAANPWLRARIARVGLLALSKEETLYFDRYVDSNAAALDARCTYIIKGGQLPARWWSITAYDNQQFLPRNTDGASSIDATRALAGGATGWTGIISPDMPSDGALWLSSKAAGKFSLTLRLYKPTSTDPSELAKIQFPEIEKSNCAGANEQGGGQ